jgi:hypothetical protein
MDSALIIDFTTYYPIHTVKLEKLKQRLFYDMGNIVGRYPILRQLKLLDRRRFK